MKKISRNAMMLPQQKECICFVVRERCLVLLLVFSKVRNGRSAAYQRRFDPAIAAMKESLAKGMVGNIQVSPGRINCSLPNDASLVCSS